MNIRTLASAGFIYVCLSGGAPAAAAIHSDAGTRSGSALLVQPGAKIRGMGNAGSAVGNDVNSFWNNPAGLGTVDRVSLTLIHKSGLADAKENHAGLIVPLGLMTAENLASFGALGAYISDFNYGRLNGRDLLGAPTGDFDAKDQVLGVSYGKSILPRVSVGMNAKFYRFELDDQKADGVAYDAGVLAVPAPGLWSLGFSVSNLGKQTRFTGREEDLPRRVTAGVAATPWGENLLLAIDAVDDKEDYAGLRAGLQWRATKIMVLRTGYDSTYGAGSGFTAGFGISLDRVEAAFFPLWNASIDYAFVPSTDLADTHNVSLSFRFGD